ncbi:hypothetical protein PROFUN_11308 [Planoprotostelium fungivorum]|uniref:Uncharacterized protein n=1 Tax=Planoprotostelium fungivorum TaxID=1890364 RepID=A0A2P6N2J4_9EUKA|nr:hypothetical protein PROFUN_11308 [Planoprotostelium fungivorum]
MFRKLTGSPSFSSPPSRSHSWTPSTADPIGLKQGLITIGNKIKNGEPYWVVLGADAIECYPKRLNRDIPCGEPTKQIPLSDVSSVLEPSVKNGNCLRIEAHMFIGMSQEESESWGAAIRSGIFLCTSAVSTEQQAQTGHWLPGSIKHVLVSFHIIQQNEWKHMRDERHYTQLTRLGAAACQVTEAVAIYTRLLGLKLTNVTSWHHLRDKLEEFFRMMQTYSCTYKDSRMAVSINNLMNLLTKIKGEVAEELSNPTMVRAYSNTAPPSVLRKSGEMHSPRQSPKHIQQIKMNLSKSFSQNQLEKKINRPTISVSADVIATSRPLSPSIRDRVQRKASWIPAKASTMRERPPCTIPNVETLPKVESPPLERNNAVEDLLGCCKDILVCSKDMAELINPLSHIISEQSQVHDTARDGTKSVLNMMKHLERVREEAGVVAGNLTMLAEDVKDGFQQLITAVRDVITTKDPSNFSRISQISSAQIPVSVRLLLRACQAVAEVRVADKRLSYTRGEVDSSLSTLLSTTDVWKSMGRIPEGGIEIHTMDNMIEAIQINRDALSALPELLKKGDTSFLFEGLKRVANSTHGLSSVLDLLCIDMDRIRADSFDSPLEITNRPRKNSLAQDKRTELRNCTHLVNATSVQLLVDSKMFISSNFSRPDLMLAVLRNTTVLLSLQNTMINTLKYYLDVEMQNYDDQMMEEEEEEEEEEYWIEEPDDSRNIVYEAGEEGEVVKAGTLNKLIEKLTASQLNDHKFQKTFLATYRSFTTPTELLTKLIQRYNILIPRLPRDINMDEYAETTIIPIQLRVINTIKLWIESAPFDFDRALRDKVLTFMQKINSEGHSISAKQISSMLQRKAKPVRLTTHLAMKDVHTLNTGALDFSKILQQYPEESIAKCLTIIDSTFFVNIKPDELMNWKGSSSKSISNLAQLSEKFNQVSYWAVSSVLECDRVNDRIKAMEKLLDLCTHLRKMNNFCSLFAIISAMNTVPIYRLSFTKEGMSQKYTKMLDNFMELMSPSGAYKNYLDCLRSINPPCVPYVGVWLTQLLHIDEGNSNKSNGLINFRKMEMFSNVILDVQLYQQMQYRDVGADQQLVSIFMQLPRDYNEDDFYALSHLREPRNAERSDIA